MTKDSKPVKTLTAKKGKANPGIFFGERAMLRGETRAATVRAAGELQCLSLSKEAFDSLGLRQKVQFKTELRRLADQLKEGQRPGAPASGATRATTSRRSRSWVIGAPGVAS